MGDIKDFSLMREHQSDHVMFQTLVSRHPFLIAVKQLGVYADILDHT
jgi:hypothetical protein